MTPGERNADRAPVDSSPGLGARLPGLDARRMSRRAVLAALPMAAALAQRRVASITTISMLPQYYHAWPTLAVRKNGELVATYSGGREQHICPFGRVELMRSNDGGRTWSWPQVVIDTPIDDRDSGVIETPKGTLLVTTFTSLAYEKTLAEAKGWAPERMDRWQAAERATTQEQREALLGMWMLRSTDGGMTWPAPYRVPVNSPHGPVAAGGRLIYAGKELYGGKRVGVCESKDDGVTWRWLAEIPARPGDDAANYHELHAVEAAPGHLIAQIRNHNKANERETLQSESMDNGKTWSVPRTIGVWGLPSHLLKLKDGRLLMTYGYRRAPMGNLARVSEDRGRTWSAPIVISDDGNGDLGYPSTVEMPDGELLTLWYEAKRPGAPMSVLRLARWRL